MDDPLELPNGDTVEPGDVILFEGYPYRYVPGEGEGFALAPVYWGDSELDLPFASRAELAERWGGASRGVLTAEEWRDWIDDARADGTFSDAELDAVADAVLDPGLLDRLRRLL